MITISLPKSTRFLQPVIRFSATFNAPTLGKYNFGIPANTGAVLIDTLGLSSIYLIDNINVGGTIDEGEYLFSVANNPFPLLRLRTRIDNQAVYAYPLPILNYIDNQPTLAWIASTKGGDGLLADFTGVLDQTPALVGVPKISIAVSFNVYQITDSAFVKSFFMPDSETAIAMQTGGVSVPSVVFAGGTNRQL